MIWISIHLALLHWSIVSTQDLTTSVTAVSGSKALLPCNITPPTEDDAVSLILWYKDDSTTPIYSLDARKGSIDQARHASDDLLSNRAYLQTQHNTATLHLQRLSEDDSGEFRCRVDFRKARTRIFQVFLKIIVPPSKPIIRDINGEPVNSLLGPLNEGDPLTLHCTANSGVPKGQIAWYRESLQLISTAEPVNFDLASVSNRNSTNEEILSASLRIERLTREHLMAVYSCRAWNNNITEPAALTAEVTVDLNLRPLTVSIDNERRPLSKDSTVQLHCHTNGSRPAAMIHWYKGIERLRSSKTRHSPDGNTSYSTLNFTPSLNDIGAILSCSSENPLIPSATIQDTWKLDIFYVPQVTLKLGSKLRYSNIQEGNDVYFECSIKANPIANEIRWWFEGVELRTNTTERIIISGNSLVLQKVSRNLRGRYTCSASNSQGEGQSNSVHLRIQHAPICSPNQRQTKYALGRMESVRVQCDVLADPPTDLVFTWYFNNSQIMATNEETSTLASLTNNGLEFATDNDNLTHNYVTTSYATYKPRTENDYGQLLCIARNAIGKQETACAFQVVPAGSPDPLRACSVRNVTDHSVYLGCIPGYNGGLKQKFVLTLQELTADQLTSTHQHLINKHLMDQNKYPSILTTDELEDYNNNEISSVNSLDKSSTVEDSNKESKNKIEKNSRKRTKSKSPVRTAGNTDMINLLEEKNEQPAVEEESTVQQSSKETNEDSLNEFGTNTVITDHNQIDLEPGGSMNLTSDRAQFYVKGLHSGSTYLCTLYAVNSRGVSRAVVLVAQTLAAPESMNRMSDGNMWQFTFNPLLMLLIAIVSIVVMIAFIVLVTIRIRFRNTSNNKTGHNDANDKSCTTPLRNTKEEMCECSFDDKCPDIIPSSKEDKLYTSSILQPNSSSSGSVREHNSLRTDDIYNSNYSSDYNLHYANTMSDGEEAGAIDSSSRLIDNKRDDDQQCHFIDNNLDKIYYHAHPLVNRTNCSMNTTNNTVYSSLNPLESTLSTTDQQQQCTRELNSPTLSQYVSLINSSSCSIKETMPREAAASLNSLKFNQEISIPTINYPNKLVALNSTNQQQPQCQSTNSSAPTSTAVHHSDLIELQNHSVRQVLAQSNEPFTRNELRTSSCSGSCNQLIHGYQPKGQPILFNNNIYSNQNRNSIAVVSSSNGGYLNHLNRFNMLRNSMRSTNELLATSGAASFPSHQQQSIYGQFTIASLRNSLAWSPIYWSNGVNNNQFHTFHTVKNTTVNRPNVTTLPKSNGLPVCSTEKTTVDHDTMKLNHHHIEQSIITQPRHLSSSLNQTNCIGELNCGLMTNQLTNQTTDSNHEKNQINSFSALNNQSNGQKIDHSSSEADKLSLYDNVDEDESSLQPLLEKSANLLGSKAASPMQSVRPSNGHVRILDNYCRDERQHSMSLNKLCL